MAHEKVYGICENKCKVEVIPKKNLLILEGEVQLNSGVGKTIPVEVDVALEDYVVMGLFQTVPDSSGLEKWTGGDNCPAVILHPDSNKVDVKCLNSSSQSINAKYRVVLLKVK